MIVTDTNAQDYNSINFSDCIKALEATHAHAYYFNQPKKGIPYESLFGGQVCFWQYAFGQPKSGPALYRKEAVVKALQNVEVKIASDLWRILPNTYTSLRNVGLFNR